MELTGDPCFSMFNLLGIVKFCLLWPLFLETTVSAAASEIVEKLKDRSLTREQSKPLLDELSQNATLESLKAVGYFYYVH